MICKSCKREVPEQSIFCLFCGEKLVRSRSRKEVSVPKPKTLADGTLFGRIMIDGVRYPVHGKTEAEYRANVLAMKEGVLEAAKPDNRLVRDVVAEYIRIRENTGKCSVTTIDSYLRRARSNLQSIMGLRVKELNTRTMQAAVDRDKQKYGGKTIHEAVSLVSSATGVKFPGLVKPDKEPKKKPPVYSSEELRRLILALAEIGGEGECAALLAMWLSLRRSEIKGLKWEDIGEGCITVKTARVYDKNHKLVEKQTKNKSSTRTIPCDPYILDKLNALPRSGEYVIKLSTSGIWTSITKACERAGIPHGYVHGLRHTNASIMALLDIDPVYSNKRGGWSKSHVRQTVYTDPMTEGELAAAGKVDSYFKGLFVYGPPLPPGFQRRS